MTWLEHLAPDIVCLQEVWRDGAGADTAAWIVDHLGGDRLVLAVRGRRRSPPAAVARRDARVRIGDPVPLADRRPRPPPAAGDRRDGTRSSTACRGSCCTSGPPGWTCSRRTWRRRRRTGCTGSGRWWRSTITCARSAATLDDLGPIGTRREGMPAILCGDFNAEPDSDEIRFLCGLTPIGERTTFWVDAWREAGIGAGPHVRPPHQPAGRGHERDHQAHRLRVRRRPVPARRRRRPRSCRPPSPSTPASPARVASDHYGLVVDIAWPTRPPP